jgi:hypothetical protein
LASAVSGRLARTANAISALVSSCENEMPVETKGPLPRPTAVTARIAALRRNASRCRRRPAAFSLFGCAAAYDGWALACHPQVRSGIRRRKGLVETTRVPRPRELAGGYRTRNRRSASTLPPSASLGDVRFAICVQACSTPPRPPQRRLQFAFGSAALCTKQIVTRVPCPGAVSTDPLAFWIDILIARKNRGHSGRAGDRATIAGACAGRADSADSRLRRRPGQAREARP